MENTYHWRQTYSTPYSSGSGPTLLGHKQPRYSASELDLLFKDESLLRKIQSVDVRPTKQPKSQSIASKRRLNSVEDLLRRIRETTFALLFYFPAEKEDLRFLDKYKTENSVLVKDDTAKFTCWTFKSTTLSDLRTLNAEFEKESCPICLEKFNKGQEVKLINKCRHLYHKKCIDEWFSYMNVCPIDKEKVAK